MFYTLEFVSKILSIRFCNLSFLSVDDIIAYLNDHADLFSLFFAVTVFVILIFTLVVRKINGDKAVKFACELLQSLIDAIKQDKDTDQLFLEYGDIIDYLDVSINYDVDPKEKSAFIGDLSQRLTSLLISFISKGLIKIDPASKIFSGIATSAFINKYMKLVIINVLAGSEISPYYVQFCDLLLKLRDAITKDIQGEEGENNE